jgi:putative NIF3 family GTP cyclohydrolase 1 type 2
MEVATLIEILREMAPQLAVQDCGHAGLFPNKASVGHLGVCVDPTAGVITNAVQRGIKILIAYHPWHGEASQLIRETEFSIIPLHTAWDNVPEGVNFTFAREIGLVDLQIRQNVVTGVANMALRDLLERCRLTVEQSIIPYRGELRVSVKKIGIWAGPGFLPFNKWVWRECVAQGCDTIISVKVCRRPSVTID